MLPNYLFNLSCEWNKSCQMNLSDHKEQMAFSIKPWNQIEYYPHKQRDLPMVIGLKEELSHAINLFHHRSFHAFLMYQLHHLTHNVRKYVKRTTNRCEQVYRQEHKMPDCHCRHDSRSPSCWNTLDCAFCQSM